MFKVSIVIPVYNSERFLNSCLNSIVNQTMSIDDIQVIIVNDGSSDGSQKIINQYVEKYPNSFVSINHKSPSGGAGKPRNTGMKYVDSEYVIFMDSDDRLDENFCQVLYNQIVLENSNIVCCNFIAFFDENFSFKNELNFKKVSFNPLKYKNEVNNIPFTVWAKIFRFNFIEDNNLTFVTQDWEDLLFSALSFYYNNSEITFLSSYNGYFYNKVDWGNTYSSSKESKSIDGLLRRVSTMNILIDFSLNNHEKIFNYFFEYLFKWHIFSLLENNLSKRNRIMYINELSEVKIISDIHLPFVFSLVTYLIKHRKYSLINFLCKIKYIKVLYVYELLRKMI